VSVLQYHLPASTPTPGYVYYHSSHAISPQFPFSFSPFRQADPHCQ